LHLSHDDNKDKIYELEISWVCDESNHIHTLVPTLLKEEAENLAL
jgi:20S proteasome subunit alpha 7